jgi:hypothetical protein
MTRIALAAFLLFIFAGIGDSSSRPPPVCPATVEFEPDTTRASKNVICPNAGDLARLQSVKGKPKAVVLQVLGHPSRVERRSNNEEVWHYPWSAACCVWIRDDFCTGTFYTGGY